MAVKTRAELAAYFVAGAEPTADQFSELIYNLASTKDANHFTGSMSVTGSVDMGAALTVVGASNMTGSVDMGGALTVTGSFKQSSGGVNIQPEILSPAASVTLTAAQAGKLLLIPSTATTDDEYVVPIPTFLGQTYHLAWSGVAIDTDDIIFKAPTADDFTFTGGIFDMKTDEAGAAMQIMVYPGADDDNFKITNVQGFDLTLTATTLTNYHIKGWVMSTDTQTAFGDL